jgi:hypothetical protein
LRSAASLKVIYASTSEMNIIAPPVAKFGRSAGGAWPYGVDIPLCSWSMSSKYASKIR